MTNKPGAGPPGMALTVRKRWKKISQLLSGNHQLLIKLPIGDFELGIGVFQNYQFVILSPISDLINTNPQFKMTNWSFYHQLLIYTFSSWIKAFTVDFKNLSKYWGSHGIYWRFVMEPISSQRTKLLYKYYFDLPFHANSIIFIRSLLAT